MKHFFKFTCAAAVLTAGIITLSSFNKAKKVTTSVDAYSIQLVSNESDDSRGVQEWTWVLTNPNPGNGLNGTLQNVSHFDVLKFNAGTVGSQPTYYRASFSQTFNSDPYSTSWINSGSRTGCNMYFFSGVGASSNN